MEVVSSQAPTSGKESGGRTLNLRMYTFSAFPPQFRPHFNTFYRSQPPSAIPFPPALRPAPTAPVRPVPSFSQPPRAHRQWADVAPSLRQSASPRSTRRPSHNGHGVCFARPARRPSAVTAQSVPRPPTPAARPVRRSTARNPPRLCKTHTTKNQIVDHAKKKRVHNKFATFGIFS